MQINIKSVLPPNDAYVRRRWLCAGGIIAGLLTLHTVAARAVQIEPGQQYQGTIVACGSEPEAETFRGFVVRGELEKANNYLHADDNSCAVGPVRFVPMAQLGDARTDATGNAWKIVKIVLPSTEAYLVTTADFVVGQPV